MTNKTKYMIAAAVGAIALFGGGFGIGSLSHAAGSQNALRMEASPYASQRSNNFDNDFDDFYEDRFDDDWDDDDFGRGRGRGERRAAQPFADLSDEQKTQIAKILGVDAAVFDNLDEDKLEDLFEKMMNLSEEDQQKLAEIAPECRFFNGHHKGQKNRRGQEDSTSGATDQTEKNTDKQNSQKTDSNTKKDQAAA